MKVYRNLNSPLLLKNAVITIGTFDGLHLGHKTIIDRLKELAKKYDGESVIITFHPHPRLVINPEDTSLKLLSTVEEKTTLLEQNGIDVAAIIPFSRDFSEQSPEDYVEQFLVHYFQPKCIVIGYDHRFGHDRKGDFSLLNKLKDKYHFTLEEISKQMLDSITISSTKIREALTDGDIIQANELLGHRYSLSGIVVKGFQNGRKLGYPTANISIEESAKLVPKNGIYAARVFVRGEWYGGMLSIGHNPTFGGRSVTIEVNILDFDNDIYGEKITIELIAYMRPELKFDSLEELIKAIDLDKVNITKVLVETN
jgi:riboflavin kinase/FMN adenylyltransferase